MLTMAAGAVAGSIIMSRMTIGAQSSPLPFLVMLAVTGGLINAVQTTMYALAAHVYPTMIRATGVGTASAVGRTDAILSGYVGPWALERGGASTFFVVMAGALLVTLIALAVIPRHVTPPPRPPTGAPERGAVDTGPAAPHFLRRSASH